MLSRAELNRAIRSRDLFNVVPHHLLVRAGEVTTKIRNDWESYVGNPNARIKL